MSARSAHRMIRLPRGSARIPNCKPNFVGYAHPLFGTWTASLGDIDIFSRGHAHLLGGTWAFPLGDNDIVFVRHGHLPWIWTSSLGDMDILIVILQS